MNTNQNILITNLAEAINWVTNAIWQDNMRKSISGFSKEDVLEQTERARNRIVSALAELEAFEQGIKNQ
jgi:hypothetical protein